MACSSGAHSICVRVSECMTDWMADRRMLSFGEVLSSSPAKPLPLFLLSLVSELESSIKCTRFTVNPPTLTDAAVVSTNSEKNLVAAADSP